MMKKNRSRYLGHYCIIFDNGGGIILQLEATWAHYYLDAAKAAENMVDYLKTESFAGWEGHEPEALACQPTNEEIRMGAYRVYTDVREMLRDDLKDKSFGYNHKDLVKSLLDYPEIFSSGFFWNPPK